MATDSGENPFIAWRRAQQQALPAISKTDESNMSQEDGFRDPAGEAALAYLGDHSTEGWTDAACRMKNKGESDTKSSLDPALQDRLDRASGVLGMVTGARKQAATWKLQLEREDRQAELDAYWG